MKIKLKRVVGRMQAAAERKTVEPAGKELAQ
jgi:hypothetical protein